MRHRAKFREDRSKRSGDMADFRFFKMAAVRHLEVFGDLHDCAKFGCNRRSNFDSMQISIFVYVYLPRR